MNTFKSFVVCLFVCFCFGVVFLLLLLLLLLFVFLFCFCFVFYQSDSPSGKSDENDGKEETNKTKKGEDGMGRQTCRTRLCKTKEWTSSNQFQTRSFCRPEAKHIRLMKMV